MQPQRKLIGQILKEQGFVTERQIQEALKAQRDKGGAIGEVLREMGAVTEDAVVTALGIQSGMETVNLDKLDIPAEVIQKVSVSIASIYKIVPVSFENNVLTVAMAEPHNLDVLDDLRFMLSCEVKGAIASETDVNAALEKYYERQSVGDIVKDISFEDVGLQVDFTHKEGSINIDIQEQISSAPVVKLLNYILVQAIKDQASDIHFEPFEEDFKVRYRLDGVLYDMLPPPRHLAQALTSRVKVMSQLNIAETRLPQDGRIQITVGGHPIDMRVSTLPTLFGESVVLRVLDRSVISLDLDRIGLRDDELKQVRGMIDKPHGIVLVTGPTGSGKTTTLYSALNEANDVGIKILTAEDPVEYDLPGIIQVEVNENIGVTFAKCLRHFLRQDPDKMLVGEIRDIETAEIAIRAALTGHLVFSTLHTNDAPSAITRLLDMGVEPYLLAATVEAVLGQRLVRTICVNCKERYEPTEEMLMQLNLTREDVREKTFYYGKGCEKCNNTGYKSRSAVFEIMTMSDRIRELLTQRASTAAIRQIAREQGMRTMRESGLLKIYDGTTTIEEVVRETLLAE
ncbi:MAG TPA: ATPase, T2SS/T4P/T4SS family [Planctomycetota bacterium]|nr:ATPase, T2SS/T4P/T4SS family [Planctomycetota bacterium]